MNYLSLIRELLACPSGEEAQILNRNRELIDDGFVQTCRQVAQELQQEGLDQMAQFLQYLARQLAELLDSQPAAGSVGSNQGSLTPEEYMQLLRELLKTEAENYGSSDNEPIFRVLAAHQDKLDLRFAQIIERWASQIIAEKPEAAEGVAALIENISNRLQSFPLGNRANNIEIAIRAYQIVLSVWTCEQNPEKWATTQNNLASAYRIRIRGERVENIENAIACFLSALEVFTRDAFPQDWAQTQNNLANAYCDGIRGERAENIENAIACFLSALEVRTRDAFPEDWAMTQNNLANAYYSRIRGERAENMENAIACYKSALEVYSRDGFTQDWAMIQNNLAVAYYSRIRGERAENIENAIACYKSALEVRTRDAFPQNWAMTQNNLGLAYSDRIRGERAQNIEEAISRYNAALEVFTRDAFPQEWAQTQHNLANAYGDLEENDKAIQAYRLALDFLTPISDPIKCLNTGRILGNFAYGLQDWENAIFGYDNAIRAVEQSRDWATSPQTKREILENALPIYGQMVEACLQLERCDRALLTVERSKSRTLLEILSQADLVPKSATPEQQELYRQLTKEIAALQQSFGEAGGQGDKGTRGQGDQETGGLAQPQSPSLEQLRVKLKERDELLGEIGDPDFEAIRVVRPELPDFGRLLGSDTALVEWYLPQDPDLGAYAFVVGPGGGRGDKGGQGETRGDKGRQGETLHPTPHTLHPTLIQVHRYSPEQRRDLDAFADRYFADYRESSWRDRLASRLEELAELLDLPQLLAKIPPTCQSLILVPHLYLHLFPLHGIPAYGGQGETRGDKGRQGETRGDGDRETWETRLKTQNSKLKTQNSPPPLQDLFGKGVRYAPSCQVLDFIQNKIQKRGEDADVSASYFFAVQNPTQDLRYTDVEIEAIRKAFDPNSYVLEREKANKAAFNSPETLNQLRRSHYLHFSCHGGFDSADPLNSALILAGDAPANPDGRRTLTLRNGRRFDTASQGLTLREIYANLDLPACRLVILSACETGLLESKLADEYVGLASGFLYAGSPSVVCSLWCVDDFATAFLAIRFYQERDLTPDAPIAQALKAAQTWMRNVSKADFLEWCATDLKMSEDDRDECDFMLEDYESDPPFADAKYWSAFCAIGL